MGNVRATNLERARCGRTLRMLLLQNYIACRGGTPDGYSMNGNSNNFVFAVVTGRRATMTSSTMKSRCSWHVSDNSLFLRPAPPLSFSHTLPPPIRVHISLLRRCTREILSNQADGQSRSLSFINLDRRSWIISSKLRESVIIVLFDNNRTGVLLATLIYIKSTRPRRTTYGTRG